MTRAVKINSALLAALDYYAKHRYSVVEPTAYVHTDAKGFQAIWTVERTCGMAHEVLADERLNLLKLRTLQHGLKQHGMERLYERIMGEKLDV